MNPLASAMLVDQIAPLITGAIKKGAVKTVGCEDADELVADCIASAARMLVSNEQRQKSVTPGNVAYYVIQNAKTGRRSMSASRTDALAPATQLDGRSAPQSLDAPLEFDGMDGNTLHEILDGGSEDPSTAVARKLDWTDLTSHMDVRYRQVLAETAQATPVKEIAHRQGVSAPRIVQIKRQIADEIAANWGTRAVEDAAAAPTWKNGLRAVRECEAARYARSKED